MSNYVTYHVVFEVMAASDWDTANETPEDMIAVHVQEEARPTEEDVVILSGLVDQETYDEVMTRQYVDECAFCTLLPSDIQLMYPSLSGTKTVTNEDGTEEEVDVWTPGGWC